MNKKHNVWDFVNFDSELEYLDKVALVYTNEMITLTEYIERIFNDMKSHVDNGLGCAVDGKLNDMTSIITMINTNTYAIDHTPFPGCKFILDMNSKDVILVKFVDPKINEILEHVKEAFIYHFCEKSDIIYENVAKHTAAQEEYNRITYLMNRIFDDRITNFDNFATFTEEIKQEIVRKYFKTENINIHKLSTGQLSAITRIPIKDIQEAARSKKIAGIKNGTKWYFDFDKVYDQIVGGYSTDETK